jgi:indole-3-glycerol phosphate synthase
VILDQIIDQKWREVAEREQRVPLREVTRLASAAPAPRKLALNGGMSLIAEVKRRSPSKGELVSTLDPADRAREYEHGGASAISVLTDAHFFGGSFEDLEAVRRAVTLPVLCKDFILCQYQLHEARARGADLILLIVAALDNGALLDLHQKAIDLGMMPLVEVHDQHELARAIAAGATLIGINNRDLADFSVDLLTTEYLAPLVPDDVVAVSESGIESREDVERVRRAGARVVLVGETLMRSQDPVETIRELLR